MSLLRNVNLTSGEEGCKDDWVRVVCMDVHAFRQTNREIIRPRNTQDPRRSTWRARDPISERSTVSYARDPSKCSVNNASWWNARDEKRLNLGGVGGKKLEPSSYSAFWFRSKKKNTEEIGCAGETECHIPRRVRPVKFQENEKTWTVKLNWNKTTR